MSRSLSCLVLCTALACLITAPLAAFAGGMASSKNFTVLTPAETSQSLADQLLARAEAYRKQIALEWLGEELPPSVGRTHINLSLSDSEDRGLTWAKERPAAEGYHTVYLSTSIDRALGSTLAHELVHVVFATQYGSKRLPSWTEEGIASRYDDPERIAERGRILQWLSRTGNWPQLKDVVNRTNIPADDTATYTVAASLVEFLLSQGDRQTLLRFAEDGAREGYDRACQRHYGLTSLADLQLAWQTWATEQYLAAR